MHDDLYTKAIRGLLTFGVIYASILGSLLVPSVQRNLFYLHRISYPFFAPVKHPEAWGFAMNRAHSVRLERDLHAWYIEPLAKQPSGVSATDSIVIYFHGTAGHVATTHRVTTYRLLTAGISTHLLAFDYRGFGRSPGIPTENGLIEDGVSAVKWAIQRGFAANQITLYGQSLGAAVALATAHELALRSEKLEVGQVITVAAFSSAREIARSYKMAGFIPMYDFYVPY